MKVFFIEHHENDLILTDFNRDYPVKYTPEGAMYFDEVDDVNFKEYIKYLNKGCVSIEELIDIAGDADFRIIDDPKNRSRARHTFGREIAALRKEAGLTQRELAEKAGMKQNNLISIELGRYSISFDNMNAIAKALGKNIKIV